MTTNGTAGFVKRMMGSPRAKATVENACKKMVINLIMKNPDLRSIMFTSCTPGDGATALVSFLAKYLADGMKKHVLLIDANYDEPGLPAIFPSRGIATSENGEPSAQHTENERIDLIPAERLEAITGHAFDTPGFQNAMAKFIAEYDVVLIDSASPTICPETLSMGPRVDGVVLIIQAERTRRHVATKAKEDLEAVGAKIVGAVLNQRLRVIPDFIYRYL